MRKCMSHVVRSAVPFCVKFHKQTQLLTSDEDVVNKFGAGKNIVYLNKPTDIEKFALSLASQLPEVESNKISSICESISNYLQPEYNLLTCLRKGVIYHHGSVPDVIRTFIEELYKNEPSIKYIITNSTLLSGVNLPAEKMFLLDVRKGRKNLSRDSFKNLVGRVCRFSEVFNPESGSLQRLEPNIYIINGQYTSKRTAIKAFVEDVAKVGKTYRDKMENVLLERTEIDLNNFNDLKTTSEFLENYEKGTISDYKYRHAQTAIGKACIMNGVFEIDIFTQEMRMQKIVEGYYSQQAKDPLQLMDMIYKILISFFHDGNYDSIKRLKHQKARNFYAMMLSWRMNNKSYSELIKRLVGYWLQRYRENKSVAIYVGKWGDEALPGHRSKTYTKLNKDLSTIINLAIVRIKDEQDFIDNVLIKYVEVLHDLNLVCESLYEQIKYGTNDEEMICLLSEGI